MSAFEQLKRSQQPQPYPLPPENPQLSLSPVRSGPFAARNNESRYHEHVKNIYDALNSLSSDVKTTKEDFEDLNSRSRDNGQALEKLMQEIKGAREDDGVSKKLTGLAQLERLDQLDQLSKLDKLDALDKVVKGLQLQSQTVASVGAPSNLEQLAKLKLLDHLTKLDNMDELKHLKQLDKLHRLDELTSLNKMHDLLQEQTMKLSALEISPKPRHEKLDNLDELSKLEKLNELDKLSKLDDLEALSRLERLDSLSELRKLEQLGNLDKLNNLSDLGRLHNLDSLSELRKLDGLSQLSKLERLDDLTELQKLGDLQKLEKLDEMNKLDQLGKLDQLNKLDKLNKLKDLKELQRLGELQQLGKLDELGKLDQLSKLEELSKLKDLTKLQRLGDLQQLEKLDELSQLSKLNKLEELNKLDSLGNLESKLNSLPDSEVMNEVKGEVRAIQDHLVGIHRSTLEELKQLREYKNQASAQLHAQNEAESIGERVQSLKQEEQKLQTQVAELKADLRSGITLLESCESKYNKLESQLRELMLSKYKGVLGTGALAVLSSNQTSNKENGLVIPKRQLRTVSLANN